MRTWKRAEKLTAAGVAVAIVAIAVSLFVPEVRRSFGLGQEFSNSATQNKQAPSISSIDTGPRITGASAHDVDELRTRNKVVRMKDTESDKPLSEVPAGSFGFALPSELMLHSPEQVRVEPRGYADNFELHKLADGHIELLGYVGPETLDHLRFGLHSGEEVTFYSDAWKDAPNLVAVPISQFKCNRDRTVELETSQKHPTLLDALDCKAD